MPSKSKNISRMNLLRVSGPVVTGDVVYAPGGICGPRVQRDYQLVVVHRGELNLRLEAKWVHLGPGEAILLSPRRREFFAFSKKTETRHSWCAIRPSVVPRNLRRRWSGLDRPVPLVGRMAKLLEWHLTEAAGGEDGDLRAGYDLGLALALCSEAALAARREVPTGAPSEALARMGDYIAAAYAEPLKLAGLARKAGVSPQHLLKLCRQESQPTPTQQLYRRRLEVAAEMLLGTGLTIAEISERCGFANPFHFSRKFRETFERSPLAWRRQHWAAQKLPVHRARP